MAGAIVWFWQPSSSSASVGVRSCVVCCGALSRRTGDGQMDHNAST